MNRRHFLAAGAAACLATPARAQDAAFAAAAQYSAERRGVSLVVMRQGEIVFEDYPNEGRQRRGWELASGTKSFTGIMVAAAMQDGLISSWDERCADTLPEWRDDGRGAITLRDLLSLTSGIDAGRIGRVPTYADAVIQPVAFPAGEHFAYGPTPFQIFGEIMRRKLAGDPLAYLQRRVFEPLDIAPTHWRRGADRNPHLPSGAGFTARDWARFGWFVMRDGEGRLDPSALRACFDGSSANPGYGLSWWLMREGLILPTGQPSADTGADLVQHFGPIHSAAGAGDQRLFLLPDKHLVIARQASGILRALRGEGGLPWSNTVFLRTLLGAGD